MSSTCDAVTLACELKPYPILMARRCAGALECRSEEKSETRVTDIRKNP